MPDFDPTAYIDQIHRMGQIAATLRHLPFDERVILAHLLDLQVACCGYCGCYVGKPGCHDSEDARDNDFGFPCPCPENMEDEEERGDEGCKCDSEHCSLCNFGAHTRCLVGCDPDYAKALEEASDGV
jgi:hypothetical protein